MFGIGIKPEDLEHLQQYVHNSQNINGDCFIDDHMDDLLAL